MTDLAVIDDGLLEVGEDVLVENFRRDGSRDTVVRQVQSALQRRSG